MNEMISIEKLNVVFTKEEIVNELKIQEYDISFLAGSLVEEMLNDCATNMGNYLSDIDVFIITKDISKYCFLKGDFSEGHRGIQFRKVKGINFDIEILEQSSLNNYIDQLNQLQFENIDTKTHNLFQKNNELSQEHFFSFIHRFIYSIVLTNCKEYGRMKSQINFDHYYQYQIRHKLNAIENQYDDIIGNMNSKQWEVAVIESRKMLINALCVLLLYSRQSIDRDKWIPLKMANLAKQDQKIGDIYSDYKKLYFECILLKDNEFAENVEDMMRLSNKIISIIEI